MPVLSGKKNQFVEKKFQLFPSTYQVITSFLAEGIKNNCGSFWPNASRTQNNFQESKQILLNINDYFLHTKAFFFFT